MIMNLKEQQGRLLDMAIIIRNILEDNNIPYMIAFGTLLGAVRHRGFIPWDDDFDFYLFGDSYNEAMNALRLNLPSDLFLEDSKSEPLYFHAWSHVKDLNSIAICNQFPQDNVYSHQGLSVDLYIMYEMREKDVDLFRLKENLKYQQRKRNSGLISETEFEHTKNLLMKKIELEEYNQSNSVCDELVYGCMLEEKMMFHKEIFPLIKYDFENNKFYGPNNANSILTRIYGDYMRMPDESLRIPHYSKVERID